MGHETVIPGVNVLPRAQEVLAESTVRVFRKVLVAHNGGSTNVTVVPREGLPLFGVAQGEEPVDSTLRALQDALGSTHPAVREITAETRELGDKSYTKFDDGDTRLVAMGTDSAAVVAGVEVVLLQKR